VAGHGLIGKIGGKIMSHPKEKPGPGTAVEAIQQPTRRGIRTSGACGVIIVTEVAAANINMAIVRAPQK